MHSQRCTHTTRADAFEIAMDKRLKGAIKEKRLKGAIARLRVSGRQAQSFSHGSKTGVTQSSLKRTNSITKLQVMCQGVEMAGSVRERV